MTDEITAALGALGTPEQIRATIAALDAMDDVDMIDKRVHFSIFAVGQNVSVLVHEVKDGSAPLLGAVRFSLAQWAEMKAQVESIVEPHEKRLTAGQRTEKD